jgi:outer membrane protein OmpA-like peptidoglycan-associated protein
MRRTVVLCLLLLVAACGGRLGPQRYVVYFEQWSAALGEEASEAVDSAAKWVKEHPAAPVTVIGYADPEGSDAANLALSRTRAEIVVDALVRAGISAARIRREAKGETRFVLNSQESRRVEIVVGTP